MRGGGQAWNGRPVACAPENTPVCATASATTRQALSTFCALVLSKNLPLRTPARITLDGFQARFPPAVADSLLLNAVTAAIEWPHDCPLALRVHCEDQHAFWGLDTPSSRASDSTARMTASFSALFRGAPGRLFSASSGASSARYGASGGEREATRTAGLSAHIQPSTVRVAADGAWSRRKCSSGPSIPPAHHTH